MMRSSVLTWVAISTFGGVAAAQDQPLKIA